ncbi:MAG: GNAT family N-acetyltransferase [Chloroflexi bacterium]|nr:GNAT family N-acetyltransferase [Chloroflexota bacterium]
METKNPAITIRSAQVEDLRELTDLCDQLGYPASESIIAQRFTDLLDRPTHAIFVAQNPEAKVIGWVHGYLRRQLVFDPHIEIGGLIVDEAHRGLRVGAELMRAVEAWAQSLGLQTIFVRTNIIRADAQQFYESRGYQLMKTSKVYQKRLAP